MESMAHHYKQYLEERYSNSHSIRTADNHIIATRLTPQDTQVYGSVLSTSIFHIPFRNLQPHEYFGQVYITLCPPGSSVNPISAENN